MSRAFKPMPVVLDLVYENFSKYKKQIQKLLLKYPLTMKN